MFSFVLFIFGSCLGSFLCLVAERVPSHRSLWQPRSHCLACQQPLKLYELVPVLSILIQRFQCRHCKSSIPLSYLIAELFTGSVTCLLFQSGFSLVASYNWLFILSTFTLALADFWYFIVEPKILYPSFLGLCLLHLYLQEPFYFLSAFILVFLLGASSHFLPGTIGTGDILLIGLWGCLLPFTEMMILLFIASSSGLLYLAITNLFKPQPVKKLPFVPFLFIGLAVCLYLQ